MKHISKVSVSVAALALSLAGCGIELDEEEGDEVGSESSEVLGGVLDTVHDDACIMEIVRPDNDDGTPPDPAMIRCTCTLVGENIVLTSAVCVARNVEKDMVDGIDIRFGDSFSGGTSFEIEPDGIEIHRYYSEETGNDDQLALIRLTATPDATPAPINEDGVLQPALPVTMVGFGEDSVGGTKGSRRFNETTIVSVSEKFFTAGTEDNTTCADDSGGPVYGSFDGGETEVLVGMTARQGDCSSTVQRMRIDRYLNFILPYVDRYTGACPADGACTEEGCRTPDPDCAGNECGWGNECEEDCPTRDWDCELGAFLGEACTLSGECEEGGRCIAATDDPTFTYCSRPCTMGVDGSCPVGMECQTGDAGAECVFLAPSPGSQGAACVGNSECRSNICENDICVFPCDGGTCPAGFECGPSSVADGMMVCLGDVVEGGGGFGLCAAGGSSRGWLSALGVLSLAWIFRRRRRAGNA